MRNQRLLRSNSARWDGGMQAARPGGDTSVGSDPTPDASDRPASGVRWPGVGLCLAAGLLAVGVHKLLPMVSALLVAVLLGIGTAHLVRLPEAVRPGVAWSAKRLLRLGIVLLGLQLALDDIVALGWRMILVVVAIVGLGICGTVLIGRLLRMRRSESILIAAGFSICGAAAVAAVDGTIEREEEDTATAIALVVIFGTAMIGIAPMLVQLSGLAPQIAGMIIGGSVHEVAQVVAAGGIVGGGALATAVIVKLARVLMLAPVVTVLSLIERRRVGTRSGGSRPPLVPLFILGFLATAGLRTLTTLPAPVINAGAFAETLLLSSAMYALGLGVHVRMLRRAGWRPLLLGGLSTLLVGTIATTGVLLAI